ncbi:MAG: FAD-binding oxidoreductase [Acidobacteria bacterium]|nr:FAD-binding oxidoreductase [Acidobacteriota bacterium]
MGKERFTDVAIIGGGVIGASIAAHLAERRVGRVVVFEREDALGTGSTAKAAGGVRLQFTTAANVALSRYSMEEIRNFKERTGVDADFVQDGYLFLLNSEADLRRFSETAVVQRELGAPVEVITPEEARRILPGIEIGDLVGATFCPEDGVATPAALVAGYAALARREGVELRRGCEVTAAVVADGGGFSFVASGERWECDWLVNAAGPWAGQVGALLGVDVPVSPVRRQFFTTEPLPWVPKKMPLTIDWGTGVYMHLHSGGMLIGNSDPDEPPGFSQTPDLDYLAGVWEDAARRMPRVENAVMKTLNAGLYEVSPDHNAILGPVPELPRFVLANGFSGHGMQHAPAVGRAISEVIGDGESRTVDISAFSVARFGTGANRPEENVI